MGTGAGSRLWREAFRRPLAFLLTPWAIALIVLTLLVEAGAFISISVLSSSGGFHFDNNIVFFLFGFVIASFLGAVWYIAAAMTGAATSFTGASAERWTAQEFAPLGPSYRLFHNIPFTDGPRASPWVIDVDHLVVGPHGAFVVESKFSSSPIDIAAARLPDFVRDAVRQAKENANRVHALLLRDAPHVKVRPVVVYWGWRVKSPAEALREVEGVWIVAGRDAKKWRPLLADGEPVVSATMIDIVASKVTKLLSRPALD